MLLSLQLYFTNPINFDFNLQNGFHTPTLAQTYVIKEVTASYAQNKKLIHKMKKLEAEVNILEKNNEKLVCLTEKENIVVSSPQVQDTTSVSPCSQLKHVAASTDIKSGIFPTTGNAKTQETKPTPIDLHLANNSINQDQVSSNTDNNNSAKVSGNHDRDRKSVV